MTLKEILLQELETADDELVTQTIDWLRSHKSSSAAVETSPSIVEFFRNSPLCEVAEELDLTRDTAFTTLRDRSPHHPLRSIPITIPSDFDEPMNVGLRINPIHP
jgi:hypothetical protein